MKPEYHEGQKRYGDRSLSLTQTRKHDKIDRGAGKRKPDPPGIAATPSHWDAILARRDRISVSTTAGPGKILSSPKNRKILPNPHNPNHIFLPNSWHNSLGQLVTIDVARKLKRKPSHRSLRGRASTQRARSS